MKQEDKELLLRYLCMALPYGVKVWYKYYPENVTEKFATSIRLVDGKIALSSKFNREGDWYPIEEANELLIKPYLRPMSSMTEEEDKERIQLGIWRSSQTNGHEVTGIKPDISQSYNSQAFQRSLGFLLKEHFDIFGLIPKGLAIEVTENNNPYKD